MAYGNIQAQIITEALPYDDLAVRLVVLAYVMVIIFTYPISIYPTNKAFEHYTVDKYTTSKSDTRYWAKNFSRFIICLTAAYAGIEMQKVLDKFLGLVGAITCAPLALILPCACHVKMIANTTEEKLQDIALIFISFLAMIFCII